MKRSRSQDCDPIVLLDVGGRTFKARKSTLSNGSTYFATLLSGDWAEEEGSADGIFVDRSPSLFDHVLQLMRRCGPTRFWKGPARQAADPVRSR